MWRFLPDILKQMNWPDLDLEDIKDLGLDWPEGDVLQGGLGGVVLPPHQLPGGNPSNTSTPTHSAMNVGQNTSINNASPMLNGSEGMLANSGYQVRVYWGAVAAFVATMDHLFIV